MVTKEKLMDLVEQGQMEMLQFAASLNENERSRSGTPEKWEARDALAHMTFWKKHDAERIAAAREGRDQPSDEGFQQTNETIFEQYREAEWGTIESLLQEAHRLLLEQMSKLSEEDLNIPGRFSTLGERPLWHFIAGCAYSHPVAHLDSLYIERGEQAYANALCAREETLVDAMDSSPEWQAVSRYNLACHWALSGEPQKALSLLPFAFRHRPDLIDWATQDTDLVSLHGTSEFEALLKQARNEQENA